MAALQIVEREADGVTVLDLWGQITIGETSEALRTKIRELIDEGRTQILLHLGGVHLVDSSGLGSLVAMYSTVRNQGGKLKLVRLSTALESLLVITKVLTVFETFDDEDEAIKSFKAGRS